MSAQRNMNDTPIIDKSELRIAGSVRGTNCLCPYCQHYIGHSAFYYDEAEREAKGRAVIWAHIEERHPEMIFVGWGS